MFSGIKAWVSHLVQRDIRVYIVVRHRIGRMRPFLPHEPDFAAFRLLPRAGGCFLDIGANDGISALSFRVFDKVTPIVSVEPNPFHRKSLEAVKKKIGKFDYLLVGAGDQDSSVRLFTPVYKGYPLTSYASLDPEVSRHNLERSMPIRNIWKDAAFVDTEVPIKRMDDFDLNPDFIKIDVEGFEDAALRGLTRTLAARLPAIMVEYNPASFSRVTEILQPLGYRAFVYDPRRRRLNPYSGEKALNIFFVHPKRSSGQADQAAVRHE